MRISWTLCRVTSRFNEIDSANADRDTFPDADEKLETRRAATRVWLWPISSIINDDRLNIASSTVAVRITRVSPRVNFEIARVRVRAHCVRRFCSLAPQSTSPCTCEDEISRHPPSRPLPRHASPHSTLPFFAGFPNRFQTVEVAVFLVYSF